MSAKTGRWCTLTAAIIALTLANGGCATHQVGMVTPGESGGAVMRTSEGREFRLVLDQESAPLRYLDGHLADVHGIKMFKRIAVTDWTVVEGLHGLQVFVGVLEGQGSQIGLTDRTSKAYYLVNRESAPDLEPFVGKPVLLEGIVSGPHIVEVMYYRVLAESDSK